MSDYITETIKRCAEINGVCWECNVRDECLMWNEDDLGTALVNVPLMINNAPTIIPAEQKGG